MDGNAYRNWTISPLIDPMFNGAPALLCVEPSTLRRFRIANRPLHDGPNRWYIVEDIPDGTLEEHAGEQDDPARVKSLLSDPSAFWIRIGGAATHARVGIRSRKIMPGDIWYPDLEQALAAIREAVDRNLWLEPGRRLLQADAAALERNRREQSLKFWKHEMELMTQASRHRPGIDPLFLGARNILGPLPKETCHEIKSYIERPLLSSWRKMRCTLITPRSTLWQAWARHDGRAPPMNKWQEHERAFPTGPALVHAISMEIRLDLQRITDALAELDPENEWRENPVCRP